MTHPVDAMLRQYVTPVMKAAGFRKKGRQYRLTGGSGDLVILEFDAMRHEVGVFGVDFVAVPLPCCDWLHRNEPGFVAPDVWGGVVRCDIQPPPEASRRPRFQGRWLVDPADEGARCGTALTTALAERYVPVMQRLLDRETVLREALDPESEVNRLWAPGMLTLFLRIDTVDKAGAEELLAGVSPDTPNREAVLEWARRRVAARTAS